MTAAIQQFLKDIEPFLSLFSTLLGLTALGFIIKLALITKEALSQQLEALRAKGLVTEERRLKEQEDRTRAERERDELRQRLAAIMDRSGINIHSFMSDPMLVNIKQQVVVAVREVLQDIRQVEAQLPPAQQGPEEHLEMARASAVAKDWPTAARHYDEYVRVHPDDWEIHYLRGVALASTRGGRVTDLASLRAYCDAIVLAPDEIDNNTRARLHTYRGAMHKRLRRLDEALCDLLLAEKLASEPYEIVDNQYNLACVYAMQGDKTQMMRCLSNLSAAPTYKEIIRHSPYFQTFRNDEDFLDWVD